MQKYKVTIADNFGEMREIVLRAWSVGNAVTRAVKMVEGELYYCSNVSINASPLTQEGE